MPESRAAHDAINAGVLTRFADRLPLTDATPRISLGEGGTPLVPAPSLEQITGAARVWLKLEFCNPTGSFKDRGMVVAVAKAIEAGYEAVLCASTGNTSASAAAYAARQGLRVYVLVPGGAVAQGKLAQAVAHGARILAVDGSFDDALQLARAVTERRSIALVNSVNPFRIAGQQTAAWEVVEALGDAPQIHCMPVGNAGNITAYWRGYRDSYDRGEAKQLPQMFGFQAAGAAPLVAGRPVQHPQTFATAIRIGNPASWQGAVAARDESGGDIVAVTDAQIRAAYEHLARAEGVFAEPAAAASVAGLLALRDHGVELAGRQVVCVISGAGLKDPDAALQIQPDRRDVPATLDGIEAALD